MIIKTRFTNHKISNLPYKEPPGHPSITAGLMDAKGDEEERQSRGGRTELSPWYQLTGQTPCCVTRERKDRCAAPAQAPNQTQADNSAVRVLIGRHNGEFCGGQADKS